MTRRRKPLTKPDWSSPEMIEAMRWVRRAPKEEWGERALVAVRCMAYYVAGRGSSIATFLNRGYRYYRVDRLRRESGWTRKNRTRVLCFAKVFEGLTEDAEIREPTPSCELDDVTRLWLRGVPLNMIAAQCGLPTGTVKSRLYRSRGLLRQQGQR